MSITTTRATLRFGGDDADVIRGGRGVDVAFGFDGADVLDGGRGRDALFGGEGEDLLLGGRGADLLDGGVGDDRLFGERGRDALRGGEGDDTLDGGRGADVLQGGEGADALIGGRGADSFVYADGEGGDVIADFQIGTDRFLLDADSFGVDASLGVQTVARDGDGVNAGLVDVDAVAAVYVLQGGFANAGAAQAALAEALADDGVDQGGGFFVYFNVNLGVNRLFAVEDLDVAGGIQQLANLGENGAGDAADLALFSESDFAFA